MRTRLAALLRAALSLAALSQTAPLLAADGDYVPYYEYMTAMAEPEGAAAMMPARLDAWQTSTAAPVHVRLVAYQPFDDLPPGEDELPPDEMPSPVAMPDSGSISGAACSVCELGGSYSGCGSSYGGCSSGCGNCDCCCCPPSGWVGGAGVYWIQPRWTNNPAFVVNRINAAGLNTTSTTNQTDFETDMQVAPLAWIGYVGSTGFGVRGRWWQFRDTYVAAVANPAENNPAFQQIIYSAFPLGAGQAITSTTNLNSALAVGSRLALDVWDVEATWQSHRGCLSYLVSGGVRYAHLAQQYNAAIDSTLTTPVGLRGVGFVDSGHSFNGVGPTGSIDLRYPVGGWFNLYANSRGSLLFGTSRAAAVSSFRNIDQNGVQVASFTQAAETASFGVLPVIEMEVGGEFTWSLGYYRLFVQTAAVGQAWFNAGNASNNEIITGTAVPDESSDSDAVLGFIGLKLAAGVTF
jgi:hypothetical protein